MDPPPAPALTSPAQDHWGHRVKLCRSTKKAFTAAIFEHFRDREICFRDGTAL